jgi:4-carboxymuconolactone decarboxylase
MDSMDTPDLELATQIRREVLGAGYADPKGPQSPFQEAFRDFTLRNCWGSVWTRDGLDRKTRSMLNLAMLAALARWNEFDVHVRGAINNGVTDEEIIEVVLQAGVYAGVPIASEAMKRAESVVRTVRAEQEAR